MGLDLTIPAGQRYSDPVDLSPENHTWILAEDEKRQVARDQIAKVGLEIWNGQYVHFESEPEPPPVEKKFEVGAFTVANLNDSDGDGKIDNAADETEVEFEDDLMRLRVTAGAGLEGKVRLVVKSGSIEFWTEKTKNAKIAQNDGKIEFTIPAEGLSKVIWIEATAKSTALRDIEIHADYVDENNAVIETLDKARATAIWAELGPRGIINGGIEVPEELDDRAANKTFNENLHSSWGVSKAVPPFNQFNYCVGIEFKVFPEGIGFEPGVHFDISRRKHGLSWVKGDVVGWVAGPVREFPVIADEPNDDIGDDDEDRFPSANLIYSLDNPAVTTAQPPDPIFRIVKRGNMVEYVRVKLGKIPIQSNNQLAGSRSSDFVPWHFRCDISRDPQGNWDFTQGHENVVASGNPPLGGKPQP
jgi:hypothetical protein